MRPVGELSKEIEPAVAGRASGAWPAGGRLVLAVGLALLGWAVPVAVLYLLW